MAISGVARAISTGANSQPQGDGVVTTGVADSEFVSDLELTLLVRSETVDLCAVYPLGVALRLSAISSCASSRVGSSTFGRRTAAILSRGASRGRRAVPIRRRRDACRRRLGGEQFLPFLAPAGRAGTKQRAAPRWCGDRGFHVDPSPNGVRRRYATSRTGMPCIVWASRRNGPSSASS